MYKNILVPYDGSEHSQHALESAIFMSESNVPVHVTVLKVAAPLDMDDSTFEIAARMAGVAEVDHKAAKAFLKEFKDENKAEIQGQIENYFSSIPENVDIHIVVESGRPQEVIVEYAEQNDIECIVMGRRGLGTIRSALGSVSTAVLRETDLPVLVVK